jgi:spermidine synthase
VLLGALVPLAVSAEANETASQAGRLLALSSLGNGLGALTMFLALYRLLDLPIIAIACSALLAGSVLVVQGGKSRPLALLHGGVIAASLIFAGLQSWPRIELLLGYRALMHEEEISWRRRNFEDAMVYKAYDQNATLARFADGGSALVLNGYRSLSFGPGSKAELHEVIVGATPALFGARTDRALVFGLGSGITGGATARLYAQTKIVEINPAMLNMPQHFETENHRVMTRPEVEVALEDGISTLLREPQLYDAIVNTVTSPQYYSAAKLYTRDFYDIVKSRLAPGGVYSGWFDVNIDREGIAIMLNTLEASFAQCRYFLLTGGYFNAVCSDGPLLYLPAETVADRLADTEIDTLFARYGFSGGLRTTMSALELDFAPRFFERGTDLLNTLDHPAIEFVVARERDATETMTRLGDMIASNIEFQHRTGFGSEAWRHNCRTLSQMSGLAFSGC